MQDREVLKMLRLSLSTEEYLMLGDDIKIVFLGGSNHHLRIMIDAPKEVNIVRSTILKKQSGTKEEFSFLLCRAKLTGKVPKKKRHETQ